MRQATTVNYVVKMTEKSLYSIFSNELCTISGIAKPFYIVLSLKYPAALLANLQARVSLKQ